VAAQVHCVDVILFAQCAGDPIPIAGVIEAAVNQNERRLTVLSPIPELEL